MTLRFRIIDQVVYLVILAESIVTYARIHYVENLETADALMFFIFNFLFFFCIYQALLLFWDIYLKSELLNIADYFFKKPESNFLVKEKDTKNEDSMSMDLQYRYVMHYIGEYIQEDETEILKEDLRLMAFEERIDERTTPFRQICSGSLKAFSQYDINHLGHAIGNHTLRQRNITEIAVFLKCCFPQVYKTSQLSTITQKLTCTDYPSERKMMIPVADKSVPLPYFDE